MKDIDHKLSREIVNTAKAHDVSVIKLERLQNIRSTTRTSRKNNHSLHTWSFYRLATFVEYKAKYPNLIKEVRGRGLILGMELTRPGREIANECLDYGAIINCTAGNVLRFVPPLNITKAHVDELISVLDKVLPKYA